VAEIAEATMTTPSASAEQALVEEMMAAGALSAVETGVRADGVRGLFATRDLAAEEMAVWIPDDVVLWMDTCEPALRRYIQKVLDDSSFNEVERQVYARSLALAVGYLLEKARGASSRFRCYIEALPSYPPTANTFSAEERAALVLLSGHDIYSMYQSLLDVMVDCVRMSAELWGESEVPERAEVEAAFFFVLSRMSYMRMMPYIDLANAALPGEENARILVDDQTVKGRSGCALVTKRPVQAGEEVVIDYNHHNAVDMLLSYGCTLGLEHLRSVTKIQFSVPSYLKGFCDSSFENGIQLQEDEPVALPEKSLLVLRMAVIGGQEELILAVKAGFFEDPPSCHNDRLEVWNRSQRDLYFQVAKFCAARRRAMEEDIRPVVLALDQQTLPGSVARTQFETDMRLLLRCEEGLLERALALSPVAS